MKSKLLSSTVASFLPLLGLVPLQPYAFAESIPPAGLSWSTVVNNNDKLPGTETPFNSYNQPSINASGFLVFRARSKGPDPMSGLFVRNLASAGSPLQTVAIRGATVPPPNNTTYAPDDLLSSFIEFPSIPRIAYWSRTLATRANFRPVWTYLPPDGESRAGTTGLFTTLNGAIATGVNTLGAVPAPTVPEVGTNWFPHFSVPGAAPGTKFDVFPGSPAITDHDVIAFKANYTEGVGKTGIFFRDLKAEDGLAPVQLIANTSTLIPNLPDGVSGIPFGSTAPPSAAGCEVVFTGYDYEEAPTYGGIYLADLRSMPELQTLVGIGNAVPGETGETFTQFGEALAFDGRYVAFWGAWGTDTVTLLLDCPTDGNADLLAYCRDFVGDNFPVQVPAHQGIFVHDTRTGLTSRVASTADGFSDFLFWTFSGRPPGVGESDESDGEVPRWRSSAFVSVSSGPGNSVNVAFKARIDTIDAVEQNYVAPLDGIYLSDGTTTSAVLTTGADGRSVDPAAPEGSVVTTLAIERESLRGRWLAITAGMVNPVTTEAMAGIYATKTHTPAPIRAGYYRGIVRDTRGTGMASVYVSRGGAYTARLFLGRIVYTTSGRLDANGAGTGTLRRNRRPARQLMLTTVERNGFTEMLLQVTADPSLPSDPDVSGPLTCEAAYCPYPKLRAVPAPFGRYTMTTLLPNALMGDSRAPQGHSAIAMRLPRSGRLTLAGRLGDGVSTTGASLVAEDGTACVYLRPYGNTSGRVIGDLSFLDIPAQSDVEGSLEWVRPASRTASRRYPAGFDLQCIRALGSVYRVPRNTTGMLALGATRVVNLSFDVEDLVPRLIEGSALINGGRYPARTNPPLKRLALDAPTGVFAGYLTNERRTFYFRGVVLQKANLGLGYILGSQHSGPLQMDVVP